MYSTHLAQLKNIRLIGVLFMFFGLAFAKSLSAHSLHVVDDSYADSANANLTTNQEKSERKRLVVTTLDAPFGEIPAGERIAYFKHEVTTLPSSTSSENIQKASIRLWVSEVVQEGTLLIHTVSENWDEKTLNFNNKPNISPFFTAVNVTKDDQDHWITVDITKQFMNWVTLPSANFGLAISAAPLPGNQAAYVVFSSKEGIYVDVEELAANAPALLAAAKSGKSSSDKHHQSRCKKHGKTYGHGHSHDECDTNYACEKNKKQYCDSYQKYDKKAKHYYEKAMKYKKYCSKSKSSCRKYNATKHLYHKYNEKAEKYKKLCQKDCGNDGGGDDGGGDDGGGDDGGGDDGGGDDGGSGTTISINQSSGHPSEIVVAVNSGTFDLLAKQYFSSKALNNLKSGRPEDNTLIDTTITLDSLSHVIYMATLSLNWQEKGTHTLQCESTLYPKNGDSISAPLVERTLTSGMESDIVNISASSFGEPLVGEVKVEVFCEIYDEQGNIIEHTTSGNVSAWSVGAD